MRTSPPWQNHDKEMVRRHQQHVPQDETTLIGALGLLGVSQLAHVAAQRNRTGGMNVTLSTTIIPVRRSSQG
jgi:hypothetical protein